MPYCEPCEHYWAPTALTVEGTCPTCGGDVGATRPEPADTADDTAPWHFKLLVVMVIVYLGWRFLQLFGIL